MNKKKTLIAAIVLLLVLLIGGAVAYFTDTDDKTNTFTLGNIDIVLEEEFNKDDAKNIMPGDTVEKKPKVANEGKNNAYVFLEVVEPCYEGETIFDFETNEFWTVVGGERACSNGTATTVYAYANEGELLAVSPDSATNTTLFNTVTLKNTLDATAINSFGDKNVDIKVTAYGIQADNVSKVPSEAFGLFSNS